MTLDGCIYMSGVFCCASEKVALLPNYVVAYPRNYSLIFRKVLFIVESVVNMSVSILCCYWYMMLLLLHLPFLPCSCSYEWHCDFLPFHHWAFQNWKNTCMMLKYPQPPSNYGAKLGFSWKKKRSSINSVFPLKKEPKTKVMKLGSSLFKKRVSFPEGKLGGSSNL